MEVSLAKVTYHLIIWQQVVDVLLEGLFLVLIMSSGHMTVSQTST